MLEEKIDAFNNLIETLTTEKQILTALIFINTLDDDAKIIFAEILTKKRIMLFGI